jgi:hypothetical protein
MHCRSRRQSSTYTEISTARLQQIKCFSVPLNAQSQSCISIVASHTAIIAIAVIIDTARARSDSAARRRVRSHELVRAQRVVVEEAALAVVLRAHEQRPLAKLEQVGGLGVNVLLASRFSSLVILLICTSLTHSLTWDMYLCSS